MNLSAATALCERHVRYPQVDCALSYGEPGYDNPARGILFADWNDCPRWLRDGLERRGFVLEWSDEWIVLHENDSKAYRTSPDCYGWTPYYVLSEDGEVYGGDEIESGDQVEWYINEYLLNNPRRANVFRGVDLAQHGFVRFNGEFETGLHPGQNDDPVNVLAQINRDLPGCDVVFSIESVDQFDMHWTAWVRARIDSD